MATPTRLLIMTKTPIPGKVKTRLAASIGNDLACAVYRYLLKHTATFCQALEVDRRVFYAPTIVDNDAFPSHAYSKVLQVDGDLGAKMQAAFVEAFADGMERVVIIGSDCYDLTPDLLTQAFEALQNHDAVFGPALDGGYYLLGLRQMIPSVFENKPWSQPELLEATTQELDQQGYSYQKLVPLSDIDYLKDLPLVIREHFDI